MNLVYYSIAADGSGRCERQWIESIRSLRRFNRSIPVHLVLYGPFHRCLLEEAKRQEVTVHLVENYGVCFRNSPAERHLALGYYRTFHKFHALRYLPVRDALHVLYADCDTFFFADVSSLLQRYSCAHWYAREEPYSRRSPYGYRPRYIDESALAQITDREGVEFIPPYNTGLCVLNHGLSELLAENSGLLLDYAWRFLMGVRGHAGCPTELAIILRDSLNGCDGRGALPYPSENVWIVEQFATWLALGNIPGLTHDVLRPQDAIQSGEFAEPGRISRCMAAHYFNRFESEFLRHARVAAG